MQVYAINCFYTYLAFPTDKPNLFLCYTYYPSVLKQSTEHTANFIDCSLSTSCSNKINSLPARQILCANKSTLSFYQSPTFQKVVCFARILRKFAQIVFAGNKVYLCQTKTVNVLRLNLDSWVIYRKRNLFLWDGAPAGVCMILTNFLPARWGFI